MIRRVWLSCVAVVCTASSLLAGEIGFIEDFSLAPDRAVPLAQLIPGTEDYYYYHCLHYQNTEQFDKADATLKQWVERYNYTPRAIEIQNRQALLTYGRNPQQSLELIRQRLGLHFNHQREQLNQKPNLPTKLDPKQINRETLQGIALQIYPNSLQGFENTAIEWLIQQKLSVEQRRQLIERLTRPDYPNLATLIAADLNAPNSGGFGQFAIHQQMLRSQLDELLKLKPELIKHEPFINAYILKLHPSDDANWRQDPKALEAYLDRLWAFVKDLAPAYNSLKAHVLYHRLVYDRAHGVFNTERFLAYLKLPRQTAYAEPKYLDRDRSVVANLGRDYTAVTLLAPVQDDEPLVRSYLEQMFVEADDYKSLTTFIQSEYLKHVFAETKIVNGLGDPEKWYSLLPPATYQALKERVDIEFASTNKTEFGSDEAVGLDLFVKNVDTLIVKVFEINAQNYYRQNQHEIQTDINLDGLVANEEKTLTYQEPALRRVRRHFEFPTLKKRGVYVIDFIGNGKSSRALIRKGRLHFLVRTGAAGQVFTVLDDKQQKVQDATLWHAGVLYAPDKDGLLTVPFSNQPSRQPIVLSQGTFASLNHYDQEPEHYELAAAIYVDREELLARRKARVLIRPTLRVNGTPVSLGPLEEVRLAVTSVDLDNVSTTKEVGDFKLFEDQESVYEFLVPQRTASITFRLQAKIKNFSQNQKVDLAAQQTYALNEVDRTDKIEDLHLVEADGQYFIDLLGKTGERLADRPVQFTFKHRDFRHAANAVLQTDAKGRIALGALTDIDTFTATSPENVAHTWTPRHDHHTHPQTLHGAVETALQVPLMTTAEKPERNELSLLELRGNMFVADRFDALSLKDGLLSITGLPGGDYSLLLKRTGTHIRLQLTDGPQRYGYVLGSYRQLELVNPKPLQVAPVTADKDKLRIRLENANKFTRVHLFATRFFPAYSACGTLSSITASEPYLRTLNRVDSLYVAGRNIGDEYRYILDRRFQKKYPGNMLERPSLLLNPWAIRSTETGEQAAQAGEAYQRGEGMAGGEAARPATPPAPTSNPSDFADLDFLVETSLVLENVRPNKDGVIELKRADLGPHPLITIVAVDPENTACRYVSLADVQENYLDLRLAESLDPKQHFTQKKQISVLKEKGEKLTIADVTSAKFEAYDSLARVFNLYAALNPDANFLEFRFLLNWPKLKPEEQRTLYSKYACHEFDFFLSKKDPDFFRKVVRPYLENKKDKTFVDRWLLDEDLGTFLTPWQFEQLNTFERALLARRIQEERSSIARFVREQYDLQPPNVDLFNRLFQTALKGAALDTGSLTDLAMDKVVLSDQLGRQVAEGKPALGFATANGTVMASDMPALGGAMAAPAPMERNRDEDVIALGGRKAAAKSSEDRRVRFKRDLSQTQELDAKDKSYFGSDLQRRAGVQQYYRKLDKTQEWVENNYYHLPIEQQLADLIAVDGFWNDYAAADPAQPFYSIHLAEPTRNFHEMLLALALLDLPFESAKHDTNFAQTKLQLTSGGPVVVFHEEIQPARVADKTPILVSQNFFRYGDRYRHVNNEQLDKFVSDEFLLHATYGCQIVVTNPTSAPQKLDVLLQIPAGAVPVLNGQYTRSVHIDLQPYHTQTLEYYFYFPLAGDYPHYPVQVASNEDVLAFANPFTFHVVSEPTNIDKQSWEYLSQFGTEAQVLEFLRGANLLRLNLDKIAFRMADQKFFDTIVELLAKRHVYNHTLWSYSIRHNEPKVIREFLQHADQFVAQCGNLIDSELLRIDPVVRKTYQHKDYRPLVNARVGQLGQHRQILNDRFLGQYQQLLKILSYERQFDDDDLMALTYYMLLQDRVEEALGFFGKVNVDRLESRLQYDYFAAYLDFYKEQPQQALEIALQHADHPVDRWKNAFANVVNQAQEIGENQVQLADPEDRTQQQTQLASKTPSFEFAIEGKTVTLHHQNIREARVNYYLMDVELLFSRNPFVQQHSQQFSFILPNSWQTIQLPQEPGNLQFEIPEKLQSSNVLVEIVAAGETKSHAYYSNALNVQMVENYGQVRVTQGAKGKPLSKVYVKVYAKMKDGNVRFYKDGYTDLRGRFDYSSLNTNELEFVDRFSLLVLSEDQGAVVREATPPKR